MPVLPNPAKTPGLFDIRNHRFQTAKFHERTKYSTSPSSYFVDRINGTDGFLLEQQINNRIYTQR